ncbi:hypothetical protein D917_09705, partial [Trichinella nativa]
MNFILLWNIVGTLVLYSDERTYRLLIGTILENEENAIYLRDYPEYVSNEDELQFQTENEEMYAEMHSQ